MDSPPLLNDLVSQIQKMLNTGQMEFINDPQKVLWEKNGTLMFPVLSLGRSL